MLIRFGTRRSALASVQTIIQARRQDIEVQIRLIQSSGDKDRISEFLQFGVVGVFTKAGEAALIDGQADIAQGPADDLRRRADVCGGACAPGSARRNAEAIGIACAAELRRNGIVRLLERSYRAHCHQFHLIRERGVACTAE